MSTFVLIHGAWGSGWHWAAVPDELRRMGHDVVAPDLPCEDPAATFEDYAAAVLDAIGDRSEDLVVVGFSLGGLAAPLVAAARPARALIYVAALLPEPGASLNDQFRRGDRLLHTEYMAGVAGPDEHGVSHWVDFGVYWRIGCRDCSEPVARERFDRSRGQAVAPYGQPCSLAAHPDVPTRYLLCEEDRLLHNDFWREAVPERLGVEPEVMPGSHSPMASHPEELARRLVADERRFSPWRRAPALPRLELKGASRMPDELFAGLRVRDFTLAREWYERLLGEPTFFAHATEAVWTLDEGRSLAVVEEPAHAGHSQVTIFVEDLDARVTEIASRGVEPDDRVTYSNGVRKTIYLDPDGNEIGFGGAPLEAG